MAIHNLLSGSYDDDDDLYDDDLWCNRCGGEGVILICPDDMCQGAGECMHGDGEIVCPACGGSEF